MPRAKTRQPADVAAGEHIEEAEDRTRLAGRKSCQRMMSMPGVGMKLPKPVHGQHGEREQDPLPEIRNAEDIANCFK